MGTWTGTYSALVVDVNDPLSLGRARLYVPQIHGEAVTGWAAPVSAGVTVPGDQVAMTYAGADQNYPVFWPVRPVPFTAAQVGAVELGGVAAGTGVKRTGAGTAASPYTLAASVSADPGNGLVLGSDSGLFATVPQTGTVSITVTSAASATAVVTFPRAYASAPGVFTNFSSGAGPTAGWNTRAINITTTSFSVFIYGTSSSFTVVMDWLAFPTPF